MKFKRFLAILLVLCLLPVYAFAETPKSSGKLAKPSTTFQKTSPSTSPALKIGTSSYAFPLTKDYIPIEPDDDSVSNGLVQHYESENTSASYYLYEYGFSCQDYIDYVEENFAGMVDSPEIIDMGLDVDVYYYATVEERDTGDRITLNYIYEENGITYELGFWFDYDELDYQVDQITTMIAGMKKAEMTPLCNTNYYLYCPGFISNAIENDTALATDYVYSDSSEIDFNVFQFEKNGLTLQEYVEGNTASDYAPVFNNIGVELYGYYETKEFNGEEYPTVSCVFEDGDTFIHIVFWFKNDNSIYDIYRMITSLEQIY